MTIQSTSLLRQAEATDAEHLAKLINLAGEGVPNWLWTRACFVGGAFRPDLPGEDRTKSIDPEPHTFMADIDPAFMKQVFNIAQRKRKTDIHHHRKLDDLWRCFEIAKRVLGHAPRLEQGG